MSETSKHESMRTKLAAGALAGSIALSACSANAESKSEMAGNTPAAVYDHVSRKAHTMFDTAKNNAAFTLEVGPNRYEAYVDAVTIERTVGSDLSGTNAEGTYRLTAIGDRDTPVTAESIDNAHIFVLSATENNSGVERRVYQAMVVDDKQDGTSIDVSYAQKEQDGVDMFTASTSNMNVPNLTLLDSPQKLASVTSQADQVFQAMQDGTPLTFVEPLG